MLSKILIINEKNIEDSVTAEDLISAIEKAYSIQKSDKTFIPDRSHLNYQGNTVLMMPGFTDEVFGTKLVSFFPENITKEIPILSAIMIINDIENGYPKAIINGTKLTAMRTGAVGATALKHMASESSETIGIIGAGVQAYHQILLCHKQRNFKRILIADSKIEYAKNLKKNIEKHIQDLEIKVIENSNSLVEESDVIITASSSEKPVFDIDISNLKRKCFIAIGSYKPNMQELPTNTFKYFDSIFVDTPFASIESGDIKIPLDLNIISENDSIPFRKIINKEINVDKEGLNVFKSVGMALFDLTVSEMIVHKVEEKGFGQEINL